MKIQKARDGEKEGGQLTEWAGIESRPHLGGKLWDALEDEEFRRFAASFLQTKFSLFCRNLFAEAGKGVSPNDCRENDAMAISLNHFVLELSAHFLAFNAKAEVQNVPRVLEACRTNVGLLPNLDPVCVPECAFSANRDNDHIRRSNYPPHQKFFGRGIGFHSRKRGYQKVSNVPFAQQGGQPKKVDPIPSVGDGNNS